jgi:hypothetical protein
MIGEIKMLERRILWPLLLFSITALSCRLTAPTPTDTQEPAIPAPTNDAIVPTPIASATAHIVPPGLYQPAGATYAIHAVETIVLRDEAQGKDLQIRVTYPEGVGPFPVIVWSHGAYGSKDNYQPLIEFWSSHGYVCIQANHSDSRAFGFDPASTFGDWESRPKDIIFILDSLDALVAAAPELNGKMDASRVGVGGHSFGAHTAQLLAGVTSQTSGQSQPISHADPRPLAFVMLSAQGTGEMLNADSWDSLTRPALFATGSNDDSGRTGKPYTWRLEPFDYSPPGDKYLLFIEGAYHNYGGISGAHVVSTGPDNPQHVLYVQTVTLAFWDAYLKRDPLALEYLNSPALEQITAGEAALTHK